MTPADLANRIARLGLTQTEAARQLGLLQPNLSRLIRRQQPFTRQQEAWLEQELARLESERAVPR